MNDRLRSALLLAGRLVLIVIMLFLITAMASHNISEFVYQGF